MTQNGAPGNRPATVIRGSHVYEADFPYTGKLSDLRELMSSLRAHPADADYSIDNGVMVIRYSG